MNLGSLLISFVSPSFFLSIGLAGPIQVRELRRDFVARFQWSASSQH